MVFEIIIKSHIPVNHTETLTTQGLDTVHVIGHQCLINKPLAFALLFLRFSQD